MVGLRIGNSGGIITNLSQNPLRVIESTGRIWTGVSSVNDAVNQRNTYLFRIPFTVGQDATTGALAFGAWFLYVSGYTASIKSIDPSNPTVSIEYTIESCTVEGLSSGSVPVYFGGSRSVFVGANADVVSDEFVSPQGTRFRRGDRGFIKIRASVSATNLTRGFPRAVGRDVVNGSTGQAYRWNPASGQTLSDIDTYGAWTGTAIVGGNSAAGGGTISPILLGRPVIDGMSTAVMRDSIGEGTGTAGDTANQGATFGQGVKTRGYTNSGTQPYPCLNMSKSGAGVQMLSLSKVQDYLKYTNAVDIGMMVNDFNAGTPVATVTANITSIISTIRNVCGIDYVSQDLPLPYTTSTDSFATEANQTVRTVSGVSWSTFDSAFRSWAAAALSAGVLDRTVDFTGVRGTDTTKWKVGDTTDGLHPNSSGVTDMLTTQVAAIQIR